MSLNLSDSLRMAWYIATQPYLLASLLSLLLATFVYFYGVLGFVVITGHPVFLVLVGWTLFLLLIERIRPILQQFVKKLSRAFLRWIKQALTPGKKNLGEEDRQFVSEMVETAKECFNGVCLAVSEQEAG